MTSDVAVALFALVSSAAPTPLPTIEDLTAEYYEARAYAPAWLDPEGRAAASWLLRQAARADLDGLCAPREATRLLAGLHSPSAASAQSAAALDLEVTRTLLNYVVELSLGRDTAMDRTASRRQLDVLGELDALRDGQHRDLAATLVPRHREYHRLRTALARYRTIAGRGGWPQLPEGTLLRPGEQVRPEVLHPLRARLLATGDLQGGDATPERYAGVLPDAVRRFQARHGLAVDGIVGPATLGAMNVPADRRAQQIAINMDRWRRLPDSLGKRYVRVNIPEYRLSLVAESHELLSMRVVVGRPSTETPAFSDRIRYVQFRPYWNVPESIARRELWPRGAAEPGTLTAEGYEVIAGWDEGAEVVDIEAIDWEAERFHYRLRQRPGPANALGLVKFMFPNRYSVYLHDTPAKRLFARRERALSHGCVRVEDPAALATELLRVQGWAADGVRAAMREGIPRSVRVEEPVPVHLLYMTTWVDDGGIVHFRADIYGRDRSAMTRFGCPPM
jgi:murein L,D-transpeptidase YcbB/YkuD